MRIIIGGDFVPTKSNIEAFKTGDSLSLFGNELNDLLSSGDLNIFNLETPITNTIDPIIKCGPNLSAPEECINGYLSANTKLLGLANNHILDQGTIGLETTIKCILQSGIDYVGVGTDLETASVPYINQFGPIKIGVYACAENEFSTATKDSEGANPFDPLESLDHVSNLSSKCDYLIVLYHGGKEYYRYPSPLLQKTCRKIVEKGANLVVCQHSHCIGTYENYMDGCIVYGQGNFLFDHGDNEYRNTGLLIKIDIENGNKFLNFIPIIKNQQYVRLADEGAREVILKSFKERSCHLGDCQFIFEQYSTFAKTNLNKYLSSCLGRIGPSFVGRVMNAIFKKNKWRIFFNTDDLVTIQNFIDCEAHRELFVQGLRSEIENRMK